MSGRNLSCHDTNSHLDADRTFFFSALVFNPFDLSEYFYPAKAVLADGNQDLTAFFFLPKNDTKFPSLLTNLLYDFSSCKKRRWFKTALFINHDDELPCAVINLPGLYKIALKADLCSVFPNKLSISILILLLYTFNCTSSCSCTFIFCLPTSDKSIKCTHPNIYLYSERGTYECEISERSFQ